jgi:endonuclease/exonuclease/phosphatase family metal-dependent hydrolase
MANLVVSMRIILFIMSLLGSMYLLGSDTLKVMNYNLLNYRNSTAQCDGSNNDANLKDGYLRSILQFTKPDIFTCNEIGSNLVNASRILDNALNTNGTDYYEQAQFSNNGFSAITNMLFYDKRKLTLSGQVAVKKDLQNVDLVRVIDIYTLYFNTSAKPGGDTIFLKVIVAHLKAGNTNDDKTERAKMTEALMEYLGKQTKRYNYLIAGDFNVQTQTEVSFQNLVNYKTEAIRFYDPVDALGSWNDNSNYSNLHTQSTHGSGGNACFSAGGMDDRFDFILMSKEIKDRQKKISYLENTYKALGNDGGRFNSDINGTTNKSVPKTILDALYGMSDHVPVLANFLVETNPLKTTFPAKTDFKVSSNFNTSIEIKNTELANQQVKAHLYNLTGKSILNENMIFDNEGRIILNTEFLNPGIYILNLQLETNQSVHFKLIK